MSMVESEIEDDFRPEYDLYSLRVRKLGPRRRNFGRLTIYLEPDVAEVFPDSEAVNGTMYGTRCVPYFGA